MADRRGRCHTLHLEYVFDRLLATKLEQVYAALVPDNARRVGGSTGLRGATNEDSCDSHARVSSDQQREEKTIASQTAALVEFAQSEGYSVPAEWIFEDEGYSGANFGSARGWSACASLAAEGQIQAVLVLTPDRLSRKYAYQVLLIEELARHGVQIVFIKAPQSDSPEDQLLLQFQGMIAEYERAQILERSRRGKLHRARQGEISVLGGAPYGYRYVRKSDERAGYYEVIEAEAQVVPD